MNIRTCVDTMTMKEHAREKDLQKTVKEAILDKYPSVWYYHPQERNQRGIPDIILCFFGRFVCIELKVERKRPTTIQAYNLIKIRTAGGYSFYSHSVKDVMKTLNEIYMNIFGDKI